MGAQDLLYELYNLDNLVELQINIPDEDWNKLRTAEPKGQWGYKGGRYDWYTATSVTITTRDFRSKTFQNVGMVKKSFMGSKDDLKPSFRLDFARFRQENEEKILRLIGTKTLVLNNCIQDPSCFRQPLGYEILREAGVPSLRCNLAIVTINGEVMGVYNNIEPFRKAFLENRFNGNTKGNAYELEYQQDIITTTWEPGTEYGTPSFEGYSEHDNEKDIKLAAKHIQNRDWPAVQKIIDIDAFIKFYAIETLLKHWDGFTGQINNTFIYNDTLPVGDPGLDNVKLKFVPSGIDQILQDEQPFQIRQGPVLAQMIMENEETKSKLYNQIDAYVYGGPFKRDFWKFHIDRLENTLKGSGLLPPLWDAINHLRNQLEGEGGIKWKAIEYVQQYRLEERRKERQRRRDS